MVLEWFNVEHFSKVMLQIPTHTSSNRGREIILKHVLTCVIST